MASKENPSLNKSFSEAALKKSPKERLQMYLNMVHHPAYKFWDHKLLQQTTLLSASNDGKLEFEFIVTPEMCNSAGTLHGGCAATMLDVLTSMPIYMIAKPGFLDGGTISRTLTCTFLRALKAGDKVKVRSEILSAGKTLCHTRGEMLNADGKIAVSCIHDKVPRHLSKL